MGYGEGEVKMIYKVYHRPVGGTDEDWKDMPVYFTTKAKAEAYIKPLRALHLRSDSDEVEYHIQGHATDPDPLECY